MDHSQPSHLTQNNLTQGSQRAKLTVESVIDQFVKWSRIASEDTARIDAGVVNFAKGYYSQLMEDRRRSKLFKFASNRGGDYFYQFIFAWLDLLKFVEANQEVHRVVALRAVLEELETKPLSVHNFVPVYNLLCVEIPVISEDGLLSLVDAVKERFQQSQPFLKRWRDCVHLLLSHISSMEKMKKDSELKSGKEFVTALIGELLSNAQSMENFRHIISIAKDLEMMPVVEKYVTETVLDEIADLSKRVESSWKAICALEHVDAKLTQRIFLALNSTWMDEETLSRGLLSLFPLLRQLLEDSPALGKTFTTLFKQQRGAILTSHFGFLTLISMCNIERYRVQMIQESKKSFYKLWKFDEEIENFGWLKKTEVGRTAEAVRQQTAQLVELIGETEDCWDLFGQPLLFLGYSLLEGGPSREVVIVDGRVVDDGSIWIFAKKIVMETLMAKRTVIPTQLEAIVHAIASSGNNGSALILIDVLVEIVKTCAIDVLNNSKLLDGLFDYVCKMRRDVGVSLIRCLLPVINQRSQLRESLFRNLKNELLNEASVGSAIPILILLLRSVSRKKCLRADSSNNFSQSFASFSTQSLETMGVKPSVDDAVALEIIGILKRCLTQPATTKTILYEGITEATTRCSSLVVPCLDLLADHALTVPSWTPEQMSITSKNIAQLREPLPQLAQTLEVLCCEALTADPTTATQAGDDVVQKATAILNKWVAKAVAEDVHDLSIDKLSEWNPTTPAGKANFVFANMMISLYDVLIEHVWKQFDAFKRSSDRDSLIGLLRRRREVEDVLAEKMVRRKEAKIGTTETSMFDAHQGEVHTSARVIADVLGQLIPTESSTEEIGDVKEELLSWCLERAAKLSRDILRVSSSLHSVVASPKHLTLVAGHLLEFYIGVDCALWMRSIDNDNSMKTRAAEAYANICSFLSNKYKNDPAKVTAIWSKEGSLASQASQANGVAGSIVRHIYLLMTKIYPALLALDRSEGRRKGGQGLEEQGKHIIKASTALLTVTSSNKAINTVFKFLAKTMASQTFSNNVFLKDFLKFLELVGLQCSDNEILFKELNTMAEELVQAMSDDAEEPSYKSISIDTQLPVVGFLMHTAERLLSSVQEMVSFIGEMSQKDIKMDELLCAIFGKLNEISELISRLLPLHTQFHVHKERLVVLLTGFFSTVEAPAELMLSNHKIVPELIEWQSVTDLAQLVKEKVQAIMAIADQKVGTLDRNEGKYGGNAKKRLAKSKKDENIYFKYVRAREKLQSVILRLSRALKDDRLNLQVKNNSIGIRDFRIDMRVLEERIAGAGEDEQTPRKRRRRPAPEETENDEGDQNMSPVY